MELESKAKAKAIEHEAEQMLENSKVKIKANEIEQEREYQKRLSRLEKRQHALILEQKEIASEREDLEEKKKTLQRKEEYLERLEQKKQAVISEAVDKMEHIASLTKEEAKAYILKKVEDQCRFNVANIVRKYTQEAKEEGQKKANYILAQATTRYAGEFAGERLINTITLPSDEHKGRIIGKEGRNIKSLEMLLGVDIIIDETPGVIIVSSFNLYRRAIATRCNRVIGRRRAYPSRPHRRDT